MAAHEKSQDPQGCCRGTRTFCANTGVVLVPHRLRPYLFEPSAEPLEHPLHVAALLHGDDSGVVLLVHPDQEGLLIVVPEENRD